MAALLAEFEEREPSELLKEKSRGAQVVTKIPRGEQQLHYEPATGYC